ncbi:MAG: binary toxin-like calcium binding domain-containing protein, partial [Candidatus Heimdallarchaeaceae archaeon]
SHQTNPVLNDTEGDGMPDGWEIEYGLNPLVNDSMEDPDNDGLTNIQEFFYGTNPLLADSDGDGYSDSEEIEAGTDPLNQDDYPLAEKNNLGLIIGLSVTGVVIVFAGIALYILKRKGLLTKILSRLK